MCQYEVMHVAAIGLGKTRICRCADLSVRLSLVIALLYSLCIHKIGLRISVHNFLSALVTACNKSRQKTRVTNLLSKALQDNMHEMIDKN